MYKLISVSQKNTSDIDLHDEDSRLKAERIALTETLNSQGLEIKATRFGNGVFATKNYAIGEIVVIGITVEESNKSIHSITGPDGKEYIYNHFAETINHHCEPNTVPFSEDTLAWSFYAIKEIKTSDEITWSYDKTEPTIGFFNGNSNDCLCGAPTCRSPLNGYTTLSLRQKEALDSQTKILQAALLTKKT